MKSEIKQRITQLKNGQIPEGYKKTSVGIVPAEWEERCIGDFLEFKNGLNKEKAAFGQGVPIVNYTDVWKKRGLKASDILGKVKLSKNEINNYNAKEGDVFFTRTSETIEEIGYASVLLEDIEDAVFSGFILRGRPYSDLVLKEYNQYCYSSCHMRHEIIKRSSITTRALTSGGMLSKVAINIPSKKEQFKIAEILMKWDEAIEINNELLRNLIKKKDYIIKKLITPRSDWGKFNLSDVLSERDERSISNNQHILLSSTKQGLFKQSEYFDKQVASENNVGYKIIKHGDIVLSPQNLWLGNINYNSEFDIGLVSPSYKIFEINNSCNKIFVSTIMKSPYMLHEYVLSSEQGASVVRRNLNMELFYKIKISLPSKSEQDAITKIILTVDNLILEYKKKINCLISQRKALQQYLLNGIVRV